VTQTIEVKLVTGLGCKPCEKVKKHLDRLNEDFPELQVTEVDIGSEEGTALAVRYRLAGLPGILINGRMSLVGEVSEKLLRERLNLVRQSLSLQA